MRASAAAGVLLIVAALSGGISADPVPTLGAVPEAARSTDVGRAPTPARSRPAPPTTRRQASPAAVDVTPSVLPPPQRLRVPALDVSARVVPVALTADGAMELPDDVSEVGWFSPGPVPGQSGSAVLAGHVDSREQGRGALFDLPDLVPGDTVEVDAGEDGTTTWRVVGRAAYPKDTLPIAELFRRDGPARLVLITCGGEFDPATGHYDDNVVVVAEPA
ncbi:MAG: class F sortase [Actinobacteria bacterium]|jgi:sortase (surface protein transpeptidase)|nr:class F sortase [Actinomycetota bacterium]